MAENTPNNNELYTFEHVKDAVSEAVGQIFPVYDREGKMSLTLDSVDIKDNKGSGDLPSQYDAVAQGKTWTVPVYANLSLRNAETGVVDKGQIKVLDLPKLTDRKTYIVKGKERQVHSVLRRKSGIFTKTDEAGRLVSEFNLDNGLHKGERIARGETFKFRFDPQKKQFYVHLGGKETINAYSLMKILGKTSEELRDIVGDDAIHKINDKITPSAESQNLVKIYSTIFSNRKIPSPGKMERDIRAAFERTQVDPDTTESTLGKRFDTVNADTLAATMQKLLDVSRGKKEEDDKESLLFKKIAAPPQLFAEQISHTSNITSIQKAIQGTLNRKIRSREGKDNTLTISPLTDVQDAIRPNVFNKPVHGLLTASTENDLLDYPSPSAWASGYNRISMLGTGAIRSMDAIPKDAPLLSPSHLGFIDPLHSPESRSSGISLHLTTGARVVGGKLHVNFTKPDGTDASVSSEEAARATVAFPDEYDAEGKPLRNKVKAQVNGVIVDVDPAKVDYILKTPQKVFDDASNLVPFIQSNQGNRAMMAGKHSTQALPLKYREEPWVLTGQEAVMGGLAGAKKSPIDGVISSIINRDGAYEIQIKPGGRKAAETVHVYRDYPMAKALLDSELKVKEGDVVKAGDLLSDSTYTKNGKLAMGISLETAYMPWKGLVFEDGSVISESAAEKLTSVHLKEKEKYEPTAIFDKARFVNWYRSTFQDPKEIDALDGDGIIKPGEWVEPGQTLMAALKKPDITKSMDKERKSLKVSPFDPVRMTWDGDVPGLVTDVKRLPKGGVKVYVKTEEKMRVGDKLVGRNANKSIVMKIEKDAEMPHTKEGKPIDLIMSPLGIVGRINLGQLLEISTAKVARQEGKPITVSPFGNQSYIEEAQNRLKDANLSDTDELVDPTHNDRSFGDVFTGPQYIYKLDHQVSHKLRGRSTLGARVNRPRYDRWDVPAGGEAGAQSIGELGTYALLSHGAIENLRDMQLYKSQKNEKMWDALLNGKPLPVPEHITPNDRFEGMLRVAGVKLKKGDTISLLPQTDKETIELAGGKAPLDDAGLMYSFFRDSVIPEKDGLFDPTKTGGTGGNRFSYFSLPEPVPNPMFEEAILRLTGWDSKKFNKIVSGDEEYAGTTGGPAISARLKEINLDDEAEKSHTQAEKYKSPKSRMQPQSKANELGRIYKRLKYIENLQKNNLRPEDVYMIKEVPVLPPKLRPITALSTGERSGEDINSLYRDLSLVANTMKQAKDHNIEGDQIRDLRSAMYDGMKALVQAKSADKPLSGAYRGVIGTISGKRPVDPAEGGGETGQSKTGLFQDQITNRKQDFSARTTIAVEPRLNLDEIGVPFEMAYTIFEPWAIKDLREKQGWDQATASKYYKDKGFNDRRVRESLVTAANDRPVIAKRDPALHKYGVQAFHPRLVDGKALQIHPLVTGGYNADFDGDQMSIYVPVHDKAVQEATKMMPSHNLFGPATGALMYTPGHEVILGLHKLTEIGKDSGKEFKSFTQAKHAEQRGEIEATDKIKIKDTVTTVGWESINQTLPPRFRLKGALENRPRLDSKHVNSMLSRIAQKDPESFVATVDALKDIGNNYSTRIGASFSLKDFEVMDKPFRDETFRQAEEEASTSDTPELVLGKTIETLDKHNKELLSSGKIHNNMYEFVNSGARGKWGQFKQIVSSPVLVYTPNGTVVPQLIKNSYSEGLNLSDYWTSLHGARKGAIDKSISTSKPGYLSKQIMRTAIDQVVTRDDCGTNQGIDMSTGDSNILGRLLTKSIKIEGDRARSYSRGTVVTPNVLSALKAHKISNVPVRSPMRCECETGVCSKCMGLDENNKMSELGVNVGSLASQSIAEPSTQLSMRVFHCNHAHSLVFCRFIGGEVLTLTMEDLFHQVDSPIEVVDEEEIKAVDGLQIYEDGKWVKLTHVRRHIQNKPMHLVSDGNLVTICQSNHPLAVFENLVHCVACGYHRLKTYSRVDGTKRVYCPDCRTYQDAPSEIRGSEEYLSPSRLTPKKHYLRRDLRPVLEGVETLPPDFPGYVAGMFLAEGCIGFRYSSPKRVIKPYSISFAQLEGPVRQRLIEFIPWKFQADARALHVHSLKLGEQFLEMFHRYSFEKRLPPDFLSYPSAWLVECLAGLIDGDGCISRSDQGPDLIGIDTTSFALAQQIVFICAKLGVVATICATKWRKLSKNQGYNVHIRATEQACALLKSSIKVRGISKFSPSQQVELYGDNLITTNRTIKYTNDYVYDATTATGLLCVGGLKSHNTGGIVEDINKPPEGDRFQKVNHLLNLTSRIPGSAILSPIKGSIDSITAAPQGGHEVTIGKSSIYVPHDRKIRKDMVPGAEVKKGEALTGGLIHPMEILKYKGAYAAQESLVDQLHQAFQDVAPIKKKHFEVVVRGMSNRTQVLDSKNSEWSDGQVIPLASIKKYNQTASAKDRVKHLPQLSGVSSAALAGEDWIAHLNTENLRGTLINAATQGWESKTHGAHPIPPLTFLGETKITPLTGFGRPTPIAEANY